MNGIHDLGGMHGFGPVRAEPGEPVFHQPWERRAFALTLAMGAWGRWTLDASRHAREQMPPAAYLATGYYEHWLYGLERLLVEHGFLTAAERAGLDRAGPVAWRWDGVETPAGPAASGPPGRGPLRPEDVAGAMRSRRGARRGEGRPARFRPGDPVLARNVHAPGHTRLPRYTRGRRGVIDRDHGLFVFPDANAHGRGEQAQHVYAVRFEARELWGPDAHPRDAVYVDLWDEYLEPGGATDR